MSLNVSNGIGVNDVYFGRNVTRPDELQQTDNNSILEDETHKSYGSDFFEAQNTEAETEPKQNVDELKAEYEEIKKEQGFVGKSWNWIKNKLPFLSKIGCDGSDKIEEIIAQAERGEISKEEAQEAIEKYGKNQGVGTEVALDVGTGLIVGAVLLLSGPLGWGTAAIIGIGAAVGAVSRIGLGAAEAGTNEVEGDYSARDGLIDGIKGAIIGAAKGAGKILGGFIPKPAKEIKKVSEQVVDNMESTNPFLAMAV